MHLRGLLSSRWSPSASSEPSPNHQDAVARRVTKFFTGKTIGQLTNVPVAMTLAGAPVRSILGWVPTSGDQPLGVSRSATTERSASAWPPMPRMIPDPVHFVELVQHHLADLAPIATEKAPCP